MKKWFAVSYALLMLGIYLLPDARAQIFNPPMFMPKPSGGGAWAGPTTNLTHRWQMDSGSISGGVVHDLVGSLDATITGTPTNVSSPSGAFASTGLSFNGSTDSLSIASTPIAGLNGGPYSVGFWVNQPDITFQPDGGGGIDPRFICFNDGTGRFGIANDSGGFNSGFLIITSYNGGVQSIISNAAQLSNNTWAHVVITISGSAELMYVNGSLVATTGGSSTDLTNGAGYNIAVREDGLRHTKGAFYQLVTYSSVLSSTDVTTLFNAK